MLSRREFLMATAALSAIAGPGLVGRWSRAAAQQALTEDALLDFEAYGNVTLVHVTDRGVGATLPLVKSPFWCRPSLPESLRAHHRQMDRMPWAA